MRRALAFAVVLLCGYLVFTRTRATPHSAAAPVPSSPAETTPAASGPAAASPLVDDASIANAIATHAREVRVDASGVVSRILPDDREGERHQRIIVRLPSGTTVLIAHNIDIAPRIEGLRTGAPIAFEGEYVWNPQGGVVHWTHHDPSGRHKTGFVKYDGHLYE
jgi:Protein of unknown function (DUF3465)